MVSKGGTVVSSLGRVTTNLGDNSHLVDARLLGLEELKIAVSQIIDQGNQASLKKEKVRISEYDMLSVDQLQRAKTLGISETRIRTIQERAQKCTDITKLVEPHMRDIINRSIAIMASFRVGTLTESELDTMLSVDIKSLISNIMPYNDSGLLDIAKYYTTGTSDNTGVGYAITFLKVLSLLQKYIADNSVSKPELSEGIENIWKISTNFISPSSSGDKELMYYYSLYDDRDGKAGIYIYESMEGVLRGSSDVRNIMLGPPVYSRLDRITESEIHPQSLDEYLCYIEEVWILGGIALNDFIPPQSITLRFIEKHIMHFGKNRSDVPSHWDINKATIKRIQRESRIVSSSPSTDPISMRTGFSKRNSQPRHAKGYTPPKIQTIAPILPERVTHSHTPQALPRPVIYGGFDNLIATAGIIDMDIRKMVSNLPPNSRLIITAHETGASESSQVLLYEQGSRISLSKLTKETTYTFSFVDLDGDAATQRPTSEVYTVVVRPRQVTAHTPRVQKITTARAADTLSQATPPIVPTFTKSNSAEDIALALLEQLELKVQGGYYIISDGKNIILSFSRIEDLPSITAIYEQGSRNMSLRGIDPIDSSLILKSIGSDLMAIFEAETKKLKELETQRILTKLSPITQRLIECTGDIVRDDAHWSLVSSRKNDSNGVNSFKGNRLLSGTPKSRIVDPFITICRELGVEIAMKDSLSKNKQLSEMQISLSLRGENGVAGSITSSSVAPYYSIDIPHTSLDKSIRSSLEAVLLEVLTLFAMVASVISSDDRLPGFRVEKLEAIAVMDGTVARNRRDRALNPDEEKSILEILARLDSGKGRIQRSREIVQYNPEDPTSDSFIRTNIISRNVPTTDIDWPDLDDNTLIVMNDDIVASAQLGQRGHVNIWRRIRKTERLQKYLLQRMMATIKGDFDDESNVSYRGKTIFKNGMSRALRVIWNTLDDKKKQEFSDLIMGTDTLPKSLTQALKVIGKDNITILELFLSQAAGDGVQLIYRRPSSISVGRLKEYRKSLPQGTIATISDD